MAKVISSARKTKTAKLQNKHLVINRNAVPFFGAFAGMLVSLPLSLAILSGMVNADVASANRSLAMRPASDNLACVAPAGTSTGTGAQGQPGSHNQAASQGSSYSKNHNKPGSSAPVFVNKLVGGTFAKNDVSVVNTGKNAKAIVVSKNVITNINNNSANNVTVQSANSGKAIVAGNAGATGDTNTGNAANANSTSITENANN